MVKVSEIDKGGSNIVLAEKSFAIWWSQENCISNLFTLTIKSVHELNKYSRSL